MSTGKLIAGARGGDSNQEWDALWETVQQVIEGDAPLYRTKYATLRAFIAKNLGVGVTARAESVGFGAVPWESLSELGGVLTKLKLPAA